MSADLTCPTCAGKRTGDWFCPGCAGSGRRRPTLAEWDALEAERDRLRAERDSLEADLERTEADAQAWLGALQDERNGWGTWAQELEAERDRYRQALEGLVSPSGAKHHVVLDGECGYCEMGPTCPYNTARAALDGEPADE